MSLIKVQNPGPKITTAYKEMFSCPVENNPNIIIPAIQELNDIGAISASLVIVPAGVTALVVDGGNVVDAAFDEGYYIWEKNLESRPSLSIGQREARWPDKMTGRYSLFYCEQKSLVIQIDDSVLYKGQTVVYKGIISFAVNSPIAAFEAAFDKCKDVMQTAIDINQFVGLNQDSFFSAIDQSLIEVFDGNHLSDEISSNPQLLLKHITPIISKAWQEIGVTINDIIEIKLSNDADEIIEKRLEQLRKVAEEKAAKETAEKERVLAAEAARKNTPAERQKQAQIAYQEKQGSSSFGKDDRKHQGVNQQPNNPQAIERKPTQFNNPQSLDRKPNQFNERNLATGPNNKGNGNKQPEYNQPRNNQGNNQSSPQFVANKGPQQNNKEAYPDKNWTCPKCGKENTTTYCPDCGTKKPVSKEWVCPNCGEKNETKFCGECGHKRPIVSENIASAFCPTCGKKCQ